MKFTQQCLAYEQFESAQQFWQHRFLDSDDDIQSTKSTDMPTHATSIQATDMTEQPKQLSNDKEHNSTNTLSTYNFFLALQTKSTTPMRIINNIFLQSQKSFENIRELSKLFFVTQHHHQNSSFSRNFNKRNKPMTKPS